MMWFRFFILKPNQYNHGEVFDENCTMLVTNPINLQTKRTRQKDKVMFKIQTFKLLTWDDLALTSTIEKSHVHFVVL